MDTDEKLKALKDLKTSERLTKQVKTMLTNIVDKLNEDERESECAYRLNTIVESLDKEINKYESCIQLFKKEQKVYGRELTLFDFIN